MGSAANDNLLHQEVPGHVDWRKRICNCSWICCSKLKKGEKMSLPEDDSGKPAEDKAVREETEVDGYRICYNRNTTD